MWRDGAGSSRSGLWLPKSLRCREIFHVRCSCAPLPGHRDRRRADGRCPPSQLEKGLIKEGHVVVVTAAGGLGSGPGHPGGGPRRARQCLTFVAPSGPGALEAPMTTSPPCLLTVFHCLNFSSSRMMAGSQGLVVSSGTCVRGHGAEQRRAAARPSGQGNWRSNVLGRRGTTVMPVPTRNARCGRYSLKHFIEIGSFNPHLTEL